MCEDCRITDQFARDDNPFKLGERPRMRTTDDDLRERELAAPRPTASRARIKGDVVRYLARPSSPPPSSCSGLTRSSRATAPSLALDPRLDRQSTRLNSSH